MTGESNEASIDFGPLASLIGVWRGDKGMDVAPEPDGPENNPFYETITFQEVGEVENAQTQRLVAVHYHQIVSRKSDNNVFHNETGYWMWDGATGVLMHSLLIPRAVGLIAGGRWEGTPTEPVVLEVAAKHDDPDWQIVQSPFMRDNARTLEFRQKLTVDSGKLAYKETTIVDIYGKVFEHTDENELIKLGT